MFIALWTDERGAVLTAELILLLVVLVVGTGVGFVALRDAMDAQMVDCAAAVAALDASYSFSGVAYYAPVLSDNVAITGVNGSAFFASVTRDNVVGFTPAVVLASTTPPGSKEFP